jgi:type III restriction enzyme
MPKLIVKVLTGCKSLDEFKNNLHKFIQEVMKIIQREMRLLLNGCVKYYKIGDDAYYAVELSQNEELLAYLNDNALCIEKSPFDHVIYDSDIEVSFVQRFESDESVKLCVKLPSCLKIHTPIGSYNLGCALVIDNDGKEKLYTSSSKRKARNGEEDCILKDQQKATSVTNTLKQSIQILNSSFLRMELMNVCCGR